MATHLTIAEARSQIELFTLAAYQPLLTATEISALLLLAKRAGPPFSVTLVGSSTLLTTEIAPDEYDEWDNATAYVLGDLIVPEQRNGHYYKVTTAGTSGTTEPTFPTTSGGTVVDGTVTWTEQGSSLWTPTFQLSSAIAHGWELKAGKLATAYDIESSTQKLTRSQMFRQCMEMAKTWKKKSAYSLELIGSLRGRDGLNSIIANGPEDCGCMLSTCWSCIARGTSWSNYDDLAFGRSWDLGSWRI